MAQMMDHVEYLTKEIGPRPAGTEEEQQAALYITEQFQKETGFTAEMEEFSSTSNPGLLQAGLALLLILVAILAMFFPILAIPAFVLGAAAAALYALEAFDRPLLTRMVARGVSQNVVAKYQPGQDTEGGRRPRSRKIVLVAHYDTGQVTPGLVERFNSFGVPWGLVCVAGMIAAAFLLLIRVFIASSGGMGLIVLNTLTIIALVVCALPVVKAILMRMAPYNEGANNNATGTAALIEVARRIARGSVSEADLAENAEGDIQIHGEQAAREAGLIPEGAQIVYEAEQLEPPAELGEYDEEERLLSAKAAIAALTGKPVERRVYGSVADKLVNSRAEETPMEFANPEHDNNVEIPAAASTQAIGGEPEGNRAAPSGDADGFSNAPSWFVAAQKNAKRSSTENSAHAAQVQRSKYSEAFDYAERERQEHEAEAQASEQARLAAERRAREEEARQALEASARAKAAVRAEAQQAAQIDLDAQAQTDNEATEAVNLAAEQTNPTTAASHAAQAQVQEAATAPTAEATAMPATRQAIDVPSVDVVLQQATPMQDLMASLPDIQAQAPAVSSPSRSGILRKLRTDVPSLSGLINVTPEPVSQPVSQPRSRRSAQRLSADALPSLDSASANASTRNTSERRSVAVPAVEQSIEATPLPLDVPVVPAETRTTSARATATVEAAPAIEREQPVSARSEHTSRKQARPVSEPESEVVQAANSQDTEDTPKEVSVPQTRSGSLISRLRRNHDNDLEDTPQEWLDVDADFDARSVGRARGGWESFRDDQFEDDDFGDFGRGDSAKNVDRTWQGGAYSRASLGRVNMRSGAEEEESPVEVLPEAPAETEETAIVEEIEQIYHFRNPLFKTEIWFVAMGADGESHDGVRAFLDEHRDELRGSMIIEIESLGAGELSVASEEGRVRKVTASSRVKRFTRDAVAATGIALGQQNLVGTDSIASVVQKSGLQAMHLFGAENGRPALKGSADDVLENVDNLLLDDHVNFIFELLKK